MVEKKIKSSQAATLLIGNACDTLCPLSIPGLSFPQQHNSLRPLWPILKSWLHLHPLSATCQRPTGKPHIAPVSHVLVESLVVNFVELHDQMSPALACSCRLLFCSIGEGEGLAWVQVAEGDSNDNGKAMTLY